MKFTIVQTLWSEETHKIKNHGLKQCCCCCTSEHILPLHSDSEESKNSWRRSPGNSTTYARVPSAPQEEKISVRLMEASAAHRASSAPRGPQVERATDR